MKNSLLSSFGRRKARKLRPLLQQAYDEKLPLVKISPSAPLFENSPQEVWLEIGFGGGEHLLAQLRRNKDISIVGCEPFLNGVAKLLAQVTPEDEQRLRIWPDDVRHLFNKIPSSYFSRAFILFPDPWPKARQNKRRLITSEFMSRLLRAMKGGALLHIATDDPSYVKHIQEVLSRLPELTFLNGPWSSDSPTWPERPLDWPSTRYEQKALQEGQPCAYMILQKIDIN